MLAIGLIALTSLGLGACCEIDPIGTTMRDGRPAVVVIVSHVHAERKARRAGDQPGGPHVRQPLVVDHEQRERRGAVVRDRRAHIERDHGSR